MIAAALELFAQHGVSGTSLQMIADALEVTKAAVYRQFHTKDEIVLAVADVELHRLEPIVAAAEAQTDEDWARRVLLGHLIDLAVERRRMVGFLQSDPVMVRFLAEHQPFRQLMDRLFAVLEPRSEGDQGQLPAAVLSGAIGGAVAHPLAAELDDATLRTRLLHLARRLFDLPAEGATDG